MCTGGLVTHRPVVADDTIIIHALHFAPCRMGPRTRGSHCAVTTEPAPCETGRSHSFIIL